MLPAFIIYAVVRGLHCVRIYATLPDYLLGDLHFYVTNKESLYIWLFSSILQLGFLPLVLAKILASYDVVLLAQLSS